MEKGIKNQWCADRMKDCNQQESACSKCDLSRYNDIVSSQQKEDQMDEKKKGGSATAEKAGSATAQKGGSSKGEEKERTAEESMSQWQPPAPPVCPTDCDTIGCLDNFDVWSDAIKNADLSNGNPGVCDSERDPPCCLSRCRECKEKWEDTFCNRGNMRQFKECSALDCNTLHRLGFCTINDKWNVNNRFHGRCPGCKERCYDCEYYWKPTRAPTPPTRAPTTRHQEIAKKIEIARRTRAPTRAPTKTPTRTPTAPTSSPTYSMHRRRARPYASQSSSSCKGPHSEICKKRAQKKRARIKVLNSIKHRRRRT